MSGYYSTLVVDPPWQYQASGATKADASKCYSLLDFDGIASTVPIGLAAERCHLWLWTTNAMMEHACRLVRVWGFSPLTIVTWCKPRPGVGHYLRNNTEHVLLASRGSPMVPSEKPLSTWYEWPVGRHSEKPGGFYDLAEKVSQPPFLDVFARQTRFGWDSWGYGEESLRAVGAP